MSAIFFFFSTEGSPVDVNIKMQKISSSSASCSVTVSFSLPSLLSWPLKQNAATDAWDVNLKKLCFFFLVFFRGERLDTS